MEETDAEILTKKMQQQWIVRQGSQPPAHQATGCVFKNVQGTSASLLIEQAGMKSATVSGAATSERDPNFIVVREDGRAEDVLQLIEKIRSGVRDRLGVELELQIEIW